MPDETFVRSVVLPVSAAEAFAWHERPEAFDLLTPPWQRVRSQAPTDGLRDASVRVIHLLAGPFRLAWVAEHYGYASGREFNDRQLRGPFAKWEHRHSFSDLEDGTCVLTDTVRYRLRFGAAGRVVAGAWVRGQLERLFVHRHAVTREALSR